MLVFGVYRSASWRYRGLLWERALVSNYAKSDPAEDFAETYALHHQRPQALQAVNAAKANEDAEEAEQASFVGFGGGGNAQVGFDPTGHG